MIRADCPQCGSPPEAYHANDCPARGGLTQCPYCAKHEPEHDDICPELHALNWKTGTPSLNEGRSTIAAEAQSAVYGERGKSYGHPSVNFADAAALWTVLLKDRLSDGQALTAEDVARCMIGVKLARDLHAPKRDNRVDIIGYAITLDRLETGQ